MMQAEPDRYRPGDFIVSHGYDPISRTIQFITRSYWNHAALIIDETGSTLDQSCFGFQKLHISDYTEEICIVRVSMSQSSRDKVSSFANWLVEHQPPYGWLTILAILIEIITRGAIQLPVPRRGSLICSEMIIESLKYGGYNCPEQPRLITPTDLYEMFAENVVR